jgi:hypothetical protein
MPSNLPQAASVQQQLTEGALAYYGCELICNHDAQNLTGIAAPTNKQTNRQTTINARLHVALF